MEYQGNERIAMLEQELDSIKVAFNDALDEIDLLNIDLEQANEDLLDEKYAHEVTWTALYNYIRHTYSRRNGILLSDAEVRDIIQEYRSLAATELMTTSINEVQE